MPRNEVELVVAAATDVGRERQVNEDSYGFLHSEAGDLLLVCDGMGGHAAGDLASRTARDAIAAFVASWGNQLAPADLLARAAVHGHEAVRQVAATSQANAGMGTTCVMALIKNRRAWVCNVGDSRCYLVRGGQLQQVSRDHTKARKLLDAGIITQEQFDNHPEKGVLSQALGQRSEPEPFVSAEFSLITDDYLVLCSDGVYDSTEHDMANLTNAKNPNYGAHDLVAQAVTRDGKDNATVVIGRVVDMNRSVATTAVSTPPPEPAKAASFSVKVLAGAAVGALVAGFVGGYVLHSRPEAHGNGETPSSVGTAEASDAGPTDAGSEAAKEVEPPVPPAPVVTPPTPGQDANSASREVQTMDCKHFTQTVNKLSEPDRKKASDSIKAASYCCNNLPRCTPRVTQDKIAAALKALNLSPKIEPATPAAPPQGSGQSSPPVAQTPDASAAADGPDAKGGGAANGPAKSVTPTGAH